MAAAAKSLLMQIQPVATSVKSEIDSLVGKLQPLSDAGASVPQAAADAAYKVHMTLGVVLEDLKRANRAIQSGGRRKIRSKTRKATRGRRRSA